MDPIVLFSPRREKYDAALATGCPDGKAVIYKTRVTTLEACASLAKTESG